jgi:hypothetical protein
MLQEKWTLWSRTLFNARHETTIEGAGGFCRSSSFDICELNQPVARFCVRILENGRRSFAARRFQQQRELVALPANRAAPRATLHIGLRFPLQQLRREAAA